MNNTVLGAVQWRKEVRRLFNLRYFHEPVITRWNSYYKLIREIVEYINKYESHVGNIEDNPFADAVKILPGCWPVNRTLAQCIKHLKDFVERLASIYYFTEMVQSSRATLAMGVAGLSAVQKALVDLGPQYHAPFKNRLLSRFGCFLTHPVLMLIALLPWKIDSADRREFLKNVSRLFIVCDPVATNRDQSGTKRNQLRDAFRRWSSDENIASLDPVAEDGWTPLKFEENWRLELRDNTYSALAEFALRLSRMGISEAGVERVFSKLKYIMNDLKAKTSVENVENQLVVSLRSGFDGGEFEFKPNSDAEMAKPIRFSFVELAMREFNRNVKLNKYSLPEEPQAPGRRGGGAMMMMMGGDDDVVEVDKREKCSICVKMVDVYERCRGAAGQDCSYVRCMNCVAKHAWDRVCRVCERKKINNKK